MIAAIMQISFTEIKEKELMYFMQTKPFLLRVKILLLISIVSLIIVSNEQIVRAEQKSSKLESYHKNQSADFTNYNKGDLGGLNQNRNNRRFNNGKYQPTQKDIDNLTDNYFYLFRPELRGRKIQSHQTLYQREWNGIRQVVRYSLDGNPQGCGLFFTGSNDDIADAVFYARHPKLNGRKIKKTELNLAREWQSIRNKIDDSLPVC